MTVTPTHETLARRGDRRGPRRPGGGAAPAGPGFDVTVLEQRAAPGGRAARLRDGRLHVGHRAVADHDAVGPGGGVRRRRAGPALGGPAAPAGPAVPDPLGGRGAARSTSHSDVERLREEIARFDGRDARRARRLPRRAAADLRGRASSAAGRRAFADLRSFARAACRRWCGSARVVPLHRFVARHFRHPRVREAFSFHSLFIGGDPFRVPAIYGALVYLQVLDGGWYADGGVYSLVEAMARPLDVRCGARVEAIETRARRRPRRAARGRRADRRRTSSSPTPTSCARTSCSAAGAPRRRLRPTMSCFLLYLGLRPAFARCCTTRCWSGPATATFIRDVTRGRGAAARRSRPTCTRRRARSRRWPRPAATRSRCCCRCRTCAPGSTGSAPPTGCATRSSRDLETTFGLDGLAASVRVEHRMAPPDFAREFGAVDGNAFAVEPTLHQSAYFRAPNRVPGVRGRLPRRRRYAPGRGDPRACCSARR